MTGSPCPVCGEPIIKARLSPGVTRIFDAAKVAGGEWALWHTREGLNWLWLARSATPETWSGETAYRLHTCAGRSGQQLEIGAA